ncbi:MAG: hypothetical protein HQL74_10220 [Magnetococcales bacterium]|nr:hypothetical protein [Magnetococcales bacterium]
MDAENPLLKSPFPESLQAVRDVIGLEKTLELVGNCGGTRIFIPRSMSESHRLAHMLGLSAASKLSRHFGGESLSVVRGASALRELRNRKIIDQYNKGEKVADIARTFALTERRVYTILSKPYKR